MLPAHPWPPRPRGLGACRSRGMSAESRPSLAGGQRVFSTSSRKNPIFNRGSGKRPSPEAAAPRQHATADTIAQQPGYETTHTGYTTRAKHQPPSTNLARQCSQSCRPNQVQPCPLGSLNDGKIDCVWDGGESNGLVEQPVRSKSPNTAHDVPTHWPIAIAVS